MEFATDATGPGKQRLFSMEMRPCIYRVMKYPSGFNVLLMWTTLFHTHNAGMHTLALGGDISTNRPLLSLLCIGESSAPIPCTHSLWKCFRFISVTLIYFLPARMTIPFHGPAHKLESITRSKQHDVASTVQWCCSTLTQIQYRCTPCTCIESLCSCFWFGFVSRELTGEWLWPHGNNSSRSGRCASFTLADDTHPLKVQTKTRHIIL